MLINLLPFSYGLEERIFGRHAFRLRPPIRLWLN